VPRTVQTNYLLIQSSSGNNSYVGMIGGSQTVNIYNWDYKFIMVHELMHALGFVHEHQRSDRATHVSINYGNVCQSCCSGQSCNYAFEVINWAIPVGGYDFDSVMHYGKDAFSINGQSTIVVLPPYTQWQNLIGQRTHLSEGDLFGLRSRYGVSLCEPLYAQATHCTGENTGDKFGQVAAAIQDIDLDGISDVIIGAPKNDEAGADAGKVYVVSGQTGAIIWSKLGEQAGDQFGAAVAANGPRVIVGAPRFDGSAGADTGRVYAYYSNGSQIWKKSGKKAGDRFGSSLAADADINGDSIYELLVGAPKADVTGKANVGKVFLYAGGNYTLLKSFTGENAGDSFGSSVAFVKQPIGASILIGAPFNDTTAANAGKAYVYDGSTLALKFTKVGERSGDKFGAVVAGPGVHGGFGTGMAAVAAPMYDKPGASNAGRVYLYHINSESLRWTQTGQAAGDKFGTLLAGAGDIDADGNDDVLVGSPFFDAPGVGNNAGRVDVFSAFDADTLITFEGAAAGDQLGTSGSGRLTADADGRFRMVVSGAKVDADLPGPVDVGRAYVYQSPTFALAFHAPPQPPRMGDIVHSPTSPGMVNHEDLSLLLHSWGPCAAIEPCSADIDRNWEVDVNDLLILLANWG
jgi:hypothetical protein